MFTDVLCLRLTFNRLKRMFWVARMLKLNESSYLGNDTG